MNATTLFELDATSNGHPAKYTDVLLPTMAKMLGGADRILDPFGGTGKVFLLNVWLPRAQIDAIELERGFMRHPKTTHGNALHQPWPDDTFDGICTSPTYGNRMADKLLDCAKYKRMTYAAKLKEPLHPDNSGAMQWGREYCEFHVKAWVEARRVLRSGGLFILNIKDHIRDGRRVRVTLWHTLCLMRLGFVPLQHERIATPSMRYGANSEARIPYESVILFRLERTS